MYICMYVYVYVMHCWLNTMCLLWTKAICAGVNDTFSFSSFVQSVYVG